MRVDRYFRLEVNLVIASLLVVVLSGTLILDQKHRLALRNRCGAGVVVDRWAR